MDGKKYFDYYLKAMEIRKTPEIESAIDNQTKLSKETKALMSKRYEIEDKLLELYYSISVDGFDKSIFDSNELPEHERLMQINALWAADDPRINAMKEKLSQSGKQDEISKLEEEYGKVLFEFFTAMIKLDSALNESREKLFSPEYKAKLKEYANNGVLLYFLETPDAPILSNDITLDDTIESFSFNDFISLKTLLCAFLTVENPSPSMSRKITDVYSVIDCLECEQYCSAARTIFALLESEHKNCSSAMDNYFTLDKKFRKGEQRAERIQQLLDSLKTQEYYSQVWDMVNPMYRDILNSKSNSFVDRNAIVHGDYYSKKMDIGKNDVIKLILLFINMRIISDHIQLYCEMFQKTLNYTEILLTQKLKKTKK
ncbi:MAG: hypothetical protein LKE36_04775 [Bacilli bacterium]|jgi:hypothetical protein|nr:hypothetical protein [Bacilli bacterium]